MKAGDPVRLTARFAKARMIGSFQKRKSRIDWTTRLGVLQHVTKRDSGLVVWEGCSSVEPLPMAALERVGT